MTIAEVDPSVPIARSTRHDAGHWRFGQAQPVVVADDPEGTPVWVHVETLVTSFSVRSVITDREHVEALSEVPDRWPPIMIQAGTNLVIDGMHRVTAARLLGLATMLAVVVDCRDDELVLRSVERNSAHGLPLTLPDRERAAEHVLRKNPSVSDRWVAELCALSHGTVAKLRKTIAAVVPETETTRASAPTRVGRDGKRRPEDPALLRRQIVEALAASPDASLRAIAAQVGASPETVRDVRRRLEANIDPVPFGARRLEVVKPCPAEEPQLTVNEDPAYCADMALSTFAAWFDQHNVGTEWAEFVSHIPLGRVYEVADECKRRAEVWRRFSQALELRAASSTRR
jgi:AcrR family transcriptional regulator